MRVLLLGPERTCMTQYISSLGDTIARAERRLTPESPDLCEVDWLVSYGYRYILKPDVLALYPDRAINLHISLLPWNRGADPNLWSFLEDTPKGVTIHQIDSGVDTGKILAQREITYDMTETLRTSYDRLTVAIEKLFEEAWPEIRSGVCKGHTQPVGGSVHYRRERASVEHLLNSGWDTNVAKLVGKGLVPR